MTKQADAEGRAQETVFIVDDDAAICEALCNLLESVGLNTGAYGSAEEFLQRRPAGGAGCLLLDGRLPGMTGVELQAKMREAGIGMPIVFMTAHGDVPMVRKVMKAGAVEFLTKPFQKEELLEAVQQALARDRARRERESYLNSIRARAASLSPRECEVMAMVTGGLLNKQIAAELNLSEITVKLHRRHVMEKMQAGSLAELVKLCHRAMLPSHISNNTALIKME